MINLQKETTEQETETKKEVVPEKETTNDPWQIEVPKVGPERKAFFNKGIKQ